MSRNRYRLHDQELVVSHDDERLGASFRTIARRKGIISVADGDGGRPLVLELRSSVEVTEPPATYRRVDARIPGMDVWTENGHYLVKHEDATASIRPKEDRATVHVGTDDTDRALFLASTVSLIILLSYRQRYAIHGAAASLDGSGCVLVGPSGCGKSTLMMGLIQNGWEYLSDDTLLLRGREDGVQTLAYRSDFALDPRTMERFPQLTSGRWPSMDNDRRKQWVNMRALVPEQFRTSCDPALLVFPEIANRAESRLVRMDKNSALLRLIPQSGMFMIPDRSVAQHRLTVLKRLVNQTTAYRLYAGRDLEQDPDLISELLLAQLSFRQPSENNHVSS